RGFHVTGVQTCALPILPSNWKTDDVRNETFTAGGGGAFLSVNISPLPQMQSLTDVSIKAMYEGAKTNKKIGKYDEVRWLELDGRSEERREGRMKVLGGR